MPPPAPGPFAPSISFVTLAVADVPRATAFYRTLGLEPNPRSGDRWAFFQLNGVVLALLSPDDLSREWGAAAEAAAGPRTALSHNVRSADLIDTILERVVAAGGTVCAPRGPTPWGGERAWFADPDGHRWEVVCNPRIHRDAHGGVWFDPPPEP